MSRWPGITYVVDRRVFAGPGLRQVLAAVAEWLTCGIAVENVLVKQLADGDWVVTVYYSVEAT